jgi:hypothetical protein
MPQPEEIGPLGARLAGADLAWCRGTIVFAGGSEVAVVDPPRLLELVRTDAGSLAHTLEAVTPAAFARAEAGQIATGGSNPRFTALYDGSEPGPLPAAAIGTCLVVSDRSALAKAVASALAARGVTVHHLDAAVVEAGFAGAAAALAATVERTGPVDAVVVALAGGSAGPAAASDWERVLAEHDGIVGRIHADAAWVRAVADQATTGERAIRLVVLTDATTAGGRSRAQASAQLSRAAAKATSERVAAFSVAVEADDDRATAELAAHLAASPESPALAGAELVVGPGWVGLRSHPRPGTSLTIGGPALPDWFDDTLRSLCRG